MAQPARYRRSARMWARASQAGTMLPYIDSRQGRLTLGSILEVRFWASKILGEQKGEIKR
jgi:hypothetical protein